MLFLKKGWTLEQNFIKIKTVALPKKI